MCTFLIDNTPSLASTKVRSRENNSFRVTASSSSSNSSSSSGKENNYCKPRRSGSTSVRNDILLLQNASAMIAQARISRKETSTEPSACDMALYNLFRRRKRASSRSSFQPMNSNNPRFSKAWDSCSPYYNELKSKPISHQSVDCERNGKHNCYSKLERFTHLYDEALDTRQERIEDREHKYMMVRIRKVSFDFNLKGPGHVHNDKYEPIHGILRRSGMIEVK